MENKLRLSIKGAIRFAILFGLTLSLWWFFRSYLLFLILILLVGGAGLAAISLWSSRNLLCAEVIMPRGRVGKNTAFPFCIKIENPRRFIGFTADLTYSWRNVFTEHICWKKEHLWIAPGKGYEIRQLLESRYAGRVEAQIEKFIVYDLFHLFYLQGCGRKDRGVTAYPMPEIAPDEELWSCVDGFPKENESRKRGTDYNPDYEIREYVPGDELKSIHWKLTAKQNRLMVRERLASGRQKINVLLPLGDEKEENDALMDALYYLVQLLLEKEYPVQLYWMGTGRILRTCFIAETGELEAALGEILSGSGIHAPGTAREQLEAEHPGESYILVQTGVYKGAYIR